MDIVVGGFGELRNAACPGIEQLILKAGGNASNDSDDAALLSRGRLLADVPSPTWMELHTAADGSQVLYAVLEDTNEIASFASRGGRLIAACGAVPRTHAGSCRHSCGVCARRRRSGSPHHRRLRRRVRLRASGNGIRVILEVAQMLRGEGHGPLPKPDQAASLAFVPWNALQGNAGAAAASEGIAGLAYVGLRGSERIVTLLWDGKRLTRLDEPDVPGWRGRGIDCAGSRPRHLLAIGNLLLAANEASNNVAIFRLSADGEPNLAATLPSGAPTVFVRL